MKNARVGITSQFGIVNNQNRCKFCDAEDNILRKRWERDNNPNRQKPYFKNKTWSTNMSTEGQKAHLYKYHQLEIKKLIAEYYNTHDIPSNMNSNPIGWNGNIEERNKEIIQNNSEVKQESNNDLGGIIDFCRPFLNEREFEKLTGEINEPIKDVSNDEMEEPNKLQMPQKVEITLAEYTRLLETERKYNQLKSKFNEINSIFLS